MYLRSQTPLIFFNQITKKLHHQIIAVRHFIIARPILFIPNDRQMYISHWHKTEQIIQKELFSDYFIFSFTQFNTETNDIG